MTRIIDAHHHLWQIDRFAYGWIDRRTPVLGRDYLPQDLKRELDAAGVDQAVLVQTFHSLDETRWFLALAREHAFIAGVVGWVDLALPAAQLSDVLDELCADANLVGIRHVPQGEPDDDWMTRDPVMRGLAELAKRRLTFDLHVLPNHLGHVPTMARALPQLRCVINHLAKPYIREGVLSPWDDDLAAAAACPNMYCKLSGMLTEAPCRWHADDLQPYVQHALACFGPERLMYGSDWPVCLLASGYAQQLQAARDALGDLDAAGRDAIFGGTAEQFYSLPRTRDACHAPAG